MAPNGQNTEQGTSAIIEAKRKRRQLIRDFNIEFKGPATSKSIASLPDALKDICIDIKTLGRTNIDEYRDQERRESRDRPWRREIRARADRIAQRAQYCLDYEGTEYTWRTIVEPEVFNRFSIEVACKKCRGRLWRTELTPDLSPAVDETSMAQRERRRKGCNCDQPDPLNEPGINKIFGDNSDTSLKYPASVHQQLKKRERPDRIFGLQETTRFQRLLEYIPSETRRGLARTPFDTAHKALLFPFMVLEAKSEKSADGFLDIELQTAFAVRELLRLQNGLAVACNEDHDWGGGPFVWFLSNKGEQWRVYVAHIRHEGGIDKYTISRLWDGCIDCPERALQLLRIVDYIVDWAEDYREAIAVSLRKLTTGIPSHLDRDTMSLMPTIKTEDEQTTVSEDIQGADLSGRDTIVSLSSIPRTEEQMLKTEPHNNDESKTENNTNHRSESTPKTLSSSDVGANVNLPMSNLFHRFDNEHAVIREICCVRNTFQAIFITTQNVHDLNNAKRNTEITQYWLEKVLVTERVYKVSRQVLDYIELVWTGNTRQPDFRSEPSQNYYSTCCFSAFLSDQLEQVWDLTLIAIEERAMSDLSLLFSNPAMMEVLGAPVLRSTSVFEKLLHPCAKDAFAMCKDAVSCFAVTSASGVTIQFEPHDDKFEMYHLRSLIFAVHNCLLSDIGRNVSSRLHRLGSTPSPKYEHKQFKTFYDQYPSATDRDISPIAWCISLVSNSPQLCLFLLEPLEVSTAYTRANYSKTLFFYIVKDIFPPLETNPVAQEVLYSTFEEACEEYFADLASHGNGTLEEDLVQYNLLQRQSATKRTWLENRPTIRVMDWNPTVDSNSKQRYKSRLPDWRNVLLQKNLGYASI